MIVVPSQNASTDTSRPVINSSITILLPALPKCLSNMISFTPALASSKSLQINTPLPSASPSAFNTIGKSAVSRYANAASALSNVSYAAVGISYFFIRSLENALEPSMIAAFFLGPNTLIPTCSNASTQPATNGSSGPTITKSIAFSFAKVTNLSKSITEISTHSASSAIPALPGAAYILETRLLFATQAAIACSLPPLPMINTFMIILLILLYVLYRTTTLPSTTTIRSFAISSIACGSKIHSACSITLCCRTFGVSPSSTATAFCKMIGPVSVPLSTK